MAQIKTPGVYVQEGNAFPNSVVEVSTSVPAFVGYTEKAIQNSKDVSGTPVRLSSMVEFEQVFGGPPTWSFSWSEQDDAKDSFSPVSQEFLLYLSMKIFFDNGGGACWVVSIGSYEGTAFEAKDFDVAWPRIAELQEPAIYVVPDAVALSKADHAKLCNTMLMQCAKLQSCVAILDLYDGAGIDDGAGFALATPIQDFRDSLVQVDDLKFGTAYAPWLKTNLVEPSLVNFTNLDKKSCKSLASAVRAETEAFIANQTFSQEQAELIAEAIKQVEGAEDDAGAVKRAAAILESISETYQRVMSALLARINLIPPCGAMAGIWAHMDNTVGVHEAPANVGIVSAIGLSVEISAEQQHDMNAPLNGRAINVIRSFPGRGILVWGARTLDGNSTDWRYINERRTMIMFEQSIRLAMRAFAFSSNDAQTWQGVKSMIGSFLDTQWKAGVLVGTQPSEAYRVDIGLGETMTGDDVANGLMRVRLNVALVRPVEFRVIEISQQMQT
ncbi:phage tail sheath family protein [Planktotalea sp.]|uniref:phage tail sheath family protein n=1 Tax=Planktotalea sp. TaxID=2029877 RepID=UPI003D6AF981